MADLTWYSREGADQRFLTKTEGAGLASKAESTQGDAALSGRIDAVKATAEAALPSATAAATYATKAEVEALKGQAQPAPAPDLSGYATKTEVQAADTALGQRIDTVSAVASAAAPRSDLAQYATSASVASTYATKESLAGYLTTADAESTYATKTALAQAQLGGGGQAPDLSGLATKAEVHSADSALGARIDGVKATADAALPKTEAATKYATKTDLAAYATSTSVSSTYATKEALTTATAPISGLTSKVSALETAVGGKADASALSALLPKTEAATTYATKADVASVRSAIPAAPDLSTYLTRAGADDRYSAKSALGDYLQSATARNIYASQNSVNRQISQVSASVAQAQAKADAAATKEDLAAVKAAADRAAAAQSPFKTGERYYSPVTYFWPDYYQKAPNVSKWAQILKFAGSLGIVILNRNSGNWDTFDKDFKTQAELALAAGAKRAVFYVKTQYLAATLPPGDAGRNNVPDVDKYTPEYILEQIAKAKTQYGDVCQGVFLDEAINGWGTQAGRVPAYKSLIDKIRGKYGKDFLIVINSGSNISEDMCKIDFDVCMMFEKDATAFLNEDPGTPILPAHMAAYPSTRWWAVVHGVTSENYRKVFDKADGLGIAHLYITDGKLREDPQQGGQWEPVGNPYANPPSSHILELVVPWLKGYLPLKLEVDELRSRPAVLSLGKHEAVPAGTPAGTIIVRKEA